MSELELAETCCILVLCYLGVFCRCDNLACVTLRRRGPSARGGAAAGADEYRHSPREWHGAACWSGPPATVVAHADASFLNTPSAVGNRVSSPIPSTGAAGACRQITELLPRFETRRTADRHGRDKCSPLSD